MDQVKKDVIDRCSMKEMLNLKNTLTAQIEPKVDLREVQQVLNDCQSDITEQLAQFKQKIHDKVVSQEISLTRIIERKADHKDIK